MGMMNPDSNPGSEMELAASGLGTLHQLGPLDRAPCSKFTSSTRPHIINMQHKMKQGKKDPKTACAGRGTFDLCKAGSHLWIADTSEGTEKTGLPIDISLALFSVLSLLNHGNCIKYRRQGTGKENV